MGVKTTQTYYNSGIEDSAVLLEKTAEDYDQTVARLRTYDHRSRADVAQIVDYESRAQLLRGQAIRIRELKKT